jgi:hypothetical protein
MQDSSAAPPKNQAPSCRDGALKNAGNRDRSAAEKQPQQNDHRDRHAKQPKQDSSSHVRLHEFLNWGENTSVVTRFLDGSAKQFIL